MVLKTCARLETCTAWICSVQAVSGANREFEMKRNLDTPIELGGNVPGHAVRLKELCKMVALSRSTCYKLMTTDPTFPRGFLVSTRARAFFVKDVLAWLAERSAQNAL